MSLVTVFVALIFVHSLVSARLERTVVTAPMVFAGAGIVVLLFLPEPRARPEGLEVSLRVSEHPA